MPTDALRTGGDAPGDTTMGVEVVAGENGLDMKQKLG